MNLKIQLQHPNAKAPTYATDGSGCFDLYAAEVEGSEQLPGSPIYPSRQIVCNTGVAFEVPPDHVMAIKSRSGLFFRHNVMAFPGEIDSDFRGPVMVKLVCLNMDEDAYPVIVRPGDRIAQARIVYAPKVTFEVCEQLSLTERGEQGFGSTGQGGAA